MVPIQQPVGLKLVEEQSNANYRFSTQFKFQKYQSNDLQGAFFLDSKNQWYYYFRIETRSLTDAKYARHTSIPSYIDPANYERFKLFHLMESHKLTPTYNDYDKAFAHVSVFVENWDNIDNLWISRCALVDGEDDPQVASRIHYIRNIYNNEKTLYVAGWESFSFATITENRYYYEKIHLPIVSELYLLYFTAFTMYDSTFSKQMMPRLLENLWCSTQSRNHRWNSALIEVEDI